MGYNTATIYKALENITMSQYILPFKPESVIAELGGGNTPSFHPNIDIRKLPEVDIVADFNKPLPIPDSSYDGLLSKYNLEHVSWRSVNPLLKEIYRILKPDGIVVIITANLLEQCKAVINANKVDEELVCLIFGGQKFEEKSGFDENWDANAHHSGFSPESITKTLTEVGFTNIRVLPIQTDKGLTDMIVEATKPSSEIKDAVIINDYSNMVKLNIGSFTVMNKYNWINLDILNLDSYALQNNYIFKQHDCSNSIPYQDNSSDIIVASHFIEHLTRQQGNKFLKETVRVLKPEGIIRLTVPDAKIIAQDYLSNTISRHSSHNEGVKNSSDNAQSLIELLMAGHQTIYDEDSLTKMLIEAGFVEIKKMDYQKSRSSTIEKENKDMYPELSLYIEAIKPSKTDISERLIVTEGHEIPSSNIINVKEAGTERVKFLKDNAIKNKDRILNIGCSDNFMFRGMDLDIMNVDITDEIRPEDKDKTKFKIADAHNLPFKDNEFNCSILGDILEHVKDPVQVLKEAKRVAKNIYITVPNEYEWDKSNTPFTNPAHVRHYTYKTLSSDLDKVFGKNNYKLKQYNGGGWSFFCVSYESLNKLRIALISTPFFTVPPKGYSGLEQIVWDLAEALDNEGHEVTLFAPEGSQSTKNGHLVITGKSINTANVNWLEEERKNYNIYKYHITPDKFDIVHGHTWFGFEYLLKHPHTIHTHHGGLSWTSPPPTNKPNLVGISNHMKLYNEQYFKQKGFNVNSEYVYNGIDLNKYPFQKVKSNNLLYVGRLSTFKQPHIAVELARKTNHYLDVVGGTFIDSIDYMKQLDELVNNDPFIKIYKDVTHDFKISKMQNAKAFIFPSKMGEPFGLVALEAMACGTPVIALNDGAISEIVIHGNTGFICNNMDEMVEAVNKIHTIKPEDCRKRAKELSREVMAKNYINLYNKILKEDGW